MANYNVLIKPSAVRQLETLPTKDRRHIAAKIQALATEPRPLGTKKLSGQEKYRLRQGNYRVLYSVDDEQAIVIVVRIAHRREAYR